MAFGLEKLDFEDWILGIVSSFISGGAGAVSGGFASAVVDPSHFNLAHPTKVLEMMGVMFLVSGIIKMATFLSSHSVPEVKTVTTIQTVQQANAPVVKLTTVEKTEVGPTPPKEP